ncbi:MAG: hypothetical protein H0V20_03155 [Actinobacteria bacterium]|nr:hypothetical protein [Actinomycetota bacterium]
MSTTADPLEAAHDAVARNDWLAAHELLRAADTASGLGAKDLELLAEASMWSGDVSGSIKADERSYALHLQEGERLQAAQAALRLALWNGVKGASAASQGWHRRAATLLEGEEEAVEHGYLALQRAMVAFWSRELDEALEQADRALELGRRFGDRNLEAQALARRGMVLVRKGEVAEGLGCLDEASAAAAADELKPLPATFVYCNTIETCRDLADFGRAAEWTDAAQRWFSQCTTIGFPGECRIYRGEVLQLRGAWDTATEELGRAWEELRDIHPKTAGAALYKLGEIHLLQGDLQAAEEAFEQARELGRDVQPGVALLRLAHGRVDRAARSIERALAEQTSDHLARAKLLPAQIEIALAAGDLPTARAAAAELEHVAETFKSSECRTAALDASAQAGWGAVALAERDGSEALQRLRAAARLWTEVGAPYELARTRVLLGLAYRLQDEEDEARVELVHARNAFMRLGATRDVQRAGELLGDTPLRRTFLFTDIVDSTRAAEAIGAQKWEKVLKWHDRTLQEIFASHGGEVVKQTGDGFFVAFEAPGPAVDAAVAVQRALEEHSGYAPDVRVGVHSAPAFAHGDHDYGGVGVHAAARIGALAGAGDILASRETVAATALPFGVSERGTEQLKGLSDPTELVSIEWR